MMTPEQLQTAKELITYLTRYNSDPNTKQIMDVEAKEKLRKLYVEYFRQIPNLGCDSCLISYLWNVLSAYERCSQLQPSAEQAAPEPQTEFKPMVKPKNCCKNKSK